MNKFITQKSFDIFYLRFVLKFLIGELGYRDILSFFDFPENDFFSIADYGSGSGYYSLKFVKINNCRVLYALDIDDAKLDILLKKSAKKKISHKIEIIDADLSIETRLKQESVNFGICSFLLNEFDYENKKKFLSLCSKSLVSGAKLYISDYIDCPIVKKLGIKNPLTKEKFIELFSNFSEFEIYNTVTNKYSQSYFIKKK